MKKKQNKKKTEIVTALFALLLAGSSMAVQAGKVTVEGDRLEVPVMEDQEAVEEGWANSTCVLTTFDLLGYIDEKNIAMDLGDRVVYISEDVLKQSCPDLDLSTLPHAQTITMNEDLVVEFQENLIKLGYLEPPSDGLFGEKCKAAMNKFQKEHGLEETEGINSMTLWMVDRQFQKPDEVTVTYTKPAETLEEKFSGIIDNTSEDLTPYLGPEWGFTFDPFEEVGYLDPRVELGSITAGDTDMDRMSMKVSLRIMASIDYLTDSYMLTPVFTIDYLGAFRPYISGAQLSIGNNAIYLTDVSSESSLEGIQVREIANARLDNTTVNLLKTTDAKKGILRVLCQNENYDIPLDLTTIWCLDQLPDGISSYLENDLYTNDIYQAP